MSRKLKSKIISVSVMLVAAVIVGAIGLRLLYDSHAATTCTIGSNLVNSCRPWLGAWANNYPNHTNTGAKDQILNHESRIGRQVDMAKDYLGYGATLSADAKYFAERPNTILVATWKAAPDGDWGAAGGSNNSVNQAIDAMADSIKSIAPHKIILIIWHEPENDVTPSTTSCPGAGSATHSGSPTDYVNMWHNVRARFDARGVNNVVWGMNYMLYNGGTCLIKPLWPGNNYVDWVFTDPYYNADKTDYTTRMDFNYNWLKTNSDATYDFNSKPWGFGEWGIHPTTDSLKCQGFAEAKTDLDTNRYPNLKAYIVFDSAAGGQGGGVVGLTTSGTIDTTTQNCYNSFADDPHFTDAYYQGGNPTPTVSFTAPGAGSTVSGSSVTVTASASVSSGSITNLTLKAGSTTLKSCSSSSCSASWDTTGLSNGSVTLTASTTASDGNSNSTSESVTVSNSQPVSISPPSSITSPSQTTSSINLAWQPSTDSKYPASQLTYHIFRNGNSVGSSSAGTTTYTDSGLAAGTTYSYTLTASDPAGNTSAASAAFTQKTATPPCSAPKAPAGLKASASGPTTVNLSWQAVANPSSNCVISHYVVSRGGTPLAQPTSTSYTDSTVAASTTYSYSVLAVETGNIAGPSSTVQVTTPAAPQPDPGPTAPTNVMATVLSSSQINLAWSPSTDPVTGIKQYIILRDGAQIGTSTITSFGDSGLVANTGYSYQIQAVSGGNKTASSVKVSATTLANSTGSGSGSTGGSGSGSSGSGGSGTNIPLLAGTKSVGSGSDTGASSSDNPTAEQGVTSSTEGSSGVSAPSSKARPASRGLRARQVGAVSSGFVLLFGAIFVAVRRLFWRRYTVPAYTRDPDVMPHMVVHPNNQLTGVSEPPAPSNEASASHNTEQPPKEQV